MSRILIVDDDPAILSGVSTLLEQAGYEIAQAASLAQARSHLQAFNPPSLVILDLMLPDGDGFELCRQIRQGGQYLPILMLSARDELQDRVEGLTVGADDYLTKPFAPAELVARVRAILRLAQHQRETIGSFECGKLRFDCELQRAWWDEQLLELTPKESGVLLQLMRQPSHVWGVWPCSKPFGAQISWAIRGLLMCVCNAYVLKSTNLMRMPTRFRPCVVLAIG